MTAARLRASRLNRLLTGSLDRSMSVWDLLLAVRHWEQDNGPVVGAITWRREVRPWEIERMEVRA